MRGKTTTKLEFAARIFAFAESQNLTDGWLPRERMLEAESVRLPQRSSQLWEERIACAVKGGARLHVCDEPSYPSNLSVLRGCPSVLLSSGSMAEFPKKALAIVGSREPSQAAADAACSVAFELASIGCTIVSGLARGIDAAAHRGALAASGETIAVMGTGLGQVSPTEHEDLANAILENGLLVSQFPPYSAGTKTSFPSRNGVIAGLSVVSLVMQAKPLSGTRIQMEYTNDFGRPLLLWGPTMGNEDWARELEQSGNLRFVWSAYEVSVAVEEALAKR